MAFLQLGLVFVLVGSRRRIEVVGRQVFGAIWQVNEALRGLGFGCNAWGHDIRATI